MSEIKNPDTHSALEYNPFEGPEIFDIIPTTESQLEIWLSCKLGGNDANRAFNESLSLRFEGEFNRVAFEKALNSLIIRHQSLRAAFTIDGSQMMIFMDFPLIYSFEDLSLSSLNQVQKEKLIKKYAKTEVMHIFDLLYGPLFKFSLIKFSEKEYFFTLTAHHIICDGWSLGLLIQDLGKFYTSYVQNTTPVLPEADKFTEYAREQSKFIASNECLRNENFWLDQFKNNIPVLNLPTDYPRPTPRTYKSSRIDFKLDMSLAESLKKIGIKEGCSFVNTILAAFELFLHSITGQEDIIIGLPAAGQLVTGKYGLVGHCVNLLPIRSYPNPQLNFSEYLKVRKLAILDSYEHQKLTFSSLLKKLKTTRNASRIPLVPVVFNIDMEIENDTYFQGLNFNIYSNPKEFENFELFLNLWTSKSSIQLEWSYNTQLFRKDTVAEMMRNFESLLQNIVSNPSQKIENLVELSPAIASKNVVEGNDNIKLYSRFQNKSYWLKKLDCELNITQLPTDKSSTSEANFKGEFFGKLVSSEDFSAFKNIVSNQGANLYAGLSTLVSILTARYTGLNEILIGGHAEEIIRANQNLSIIPIRIQLKDGDNFKSILKTLNNYLADAKSHTDYSYDDLLKELNFSQANDAKNLINVSTQLQRAQSLLSVNNHQPDISFIFQEIEDQLSLNIQYNANKYDVKSIERIANHVTSILHEVCIAPEVPFGKIEFLSVGERNQLLNTFSINKTSYPSTKSVKELFEEQAKKTPDNVALVFGNNEYTYTELNELANQFGLFLQQKFNTNKEELICIKLEKSEWKTIAVLGILKIGAAYVPVDIEYPIERINFIVNDCNCRIIIDDQLLNEFKAEKDKLNKVNLNVEVLPENLAYVMYTSGSTGQPKGVMVEHHNIVRLVKSCNYVPFTGKETLLSTGSFSFDATTFEYWSMLLNGGKLVLCSLKTLLDVKLLSEDIKSRGVDIMWFTSGWLNKLVEADIQLFSGLKYLLAGGDKLSPPHINKLLENHPNLKIINGYGPTENTTFSLTYQVLGVSSVIPIGKPISNSTALILDKHLQLVPIGVEGEIFLGGDGVARGYLNNEELTNEKFISNPYFPDGRLYRSGDIGRWMPDGNILFSGRKDAQVKVRGFRVELGEIESAILEHPDINNAVLVVNQEKEQEKYLVAYVTSRVVLNISEIRSFLIQKLPVYMIPAYFVAMKNLPLTPNGKVDLRKLPDPSQASSEEMTIDFHSHEEKVITEIWRDLLGVKMIRRTDNFFEIGGHSLIAIQFIIRLENEFNVKLPMSSLFEFPTVEKIAKLISSDSKIQKWKTLILIKPTGNKTPLYLVHGGGLGVLIFNNIVIYLDKEQPVYGLQALGIDGLDEPFETIEEMASFYISEILEQNPEGPYHIAGLSAGGLIAFEMAQQLKAMGKEIKVVGVFDFNLIDTEEIGSFKQKIGNIILNFFPITMFNIKSLFKYPERTIKYYIMCWKLRYVSMMRRLGYEQAEELEGLQLHLLNAITKSNDAIKKYKLKPYDGEIDLFISKEKVYFQKDPNYMGWKPYTTKGINVHEVNGDHDDMILQPNNKFFAEVLQKVMDRRN
jgi:amino acid adenylation domain-containing protein